MHSTAKTHLAWAAAFLMGVLGQSHLAAAKEWTKIRIATDGSYAPWNFHQADGTLAGYDIDLTKEICKRIKAECTIEAQAWDGIIPGLNAEKYDAIIGGMSITEKRLQAIDFSIPYADAPSSFAAMKGSPLESMETGKRVSLNDEATAKAALDALKPALMGKIVGTQSASVQSDFIQTRFKDVVTPRNYKGSEENTLDLSTGRTDAVFMSAVALAATMEKPHGKDIVMVGPLLSGGPIGKGTGVGVRKTDPELRELFNKAISEIIADGTNTQLCLKWFKVDITPLQATK